MTQRRKPVQPSPDAKPDPVLSLGSDFNGIPFALNLDTGAVEPVAPVGVGATALRATVFSYGEVTVDRLVELLCGGGYRAWRDSHGDAVVWTPIGRVLLMINDTQELLRFVAVRTFREGASETDQLELVGQLNYSGLVARYVADEDVLRIEYDLPIGCGITAPQLLQTIRSLAWNVDASLRYTKAEDWLS